MTVFFCVVYAMADVYLTKEMCRLHDVSFCLSGTPIYFSTINKANLRDLIAATGLVILLKLDSNRLFFSTCDLKTWWMTSKNYRAPLLHYIKLCASFQTPRWIHSRVTVQKRSIRVKIGNFLSRVNLNFDGWPWKTIGYLFCTTLSFLHHCKAIGELIWSYSPETLNSGQNRRSFVPCKLEIWWMTLKNNKTPLLCCVKLCASFHSHRWIQTGVTVRKRSIRVKIGNCFVPCDLEIRRMTLKNKRAPLLHYCKRCAWFRSHWWIQTGATVRKHLILVKINDVLSRVTLKFDGWPCKTNVSLV